MECLVNLPALAHACARVQNPKRLFEGNAILRRLVRYGILDETKLKLDYVLGLKPENFLDRRLQTQVFKLGLAKSIHHARVLIRQRHIRCAGLIMQIGAALLMHFALIAVSASSWSTPPHSTSAWTRRSTLTSPSSRLWVVAALAAPSARPSRRPRLVTLLPTRSKDPRVSPSFCCKHRSNPHIPLVGAHPAFDCETASEAG